MTSRRTIVDVDARGWVSLARFGINDTQLVVDRLPDGGLVLQQAMAMTPVEAAHYRNPEAADAVERGLADVEADRIRPGNLRSG